MTIKINYKEKNYQPGDEIRELSDLLINNIELLNLLSEVYMLSDKSDDNQEFEKLLDKSMGIYIATGAFYIPTFHVNVKSQQRYLQDLGCGYIEILNIDKLVDRYCS